MNTKDLKAILFALMIAGALPFLSSCEDDDDGDGGGNGNPNPGVAALDSGFLIISQIPEVNRFVRYSPEIPTGTFDVAGGLSFEEFTPRDQLQNEIFVNSLATDQGVEKFVYTESGQFESLGNIISDGEAFPVHIADQNTGYFADENDITEIVIFDPSNMQKTGQIDLIDAFFVEGAESENYGGITTRGNDLFIPYRPRINTVYASDSLIYHVIDRSTRAYVKTIFLPGHTEPRVFNFPVIDEQGNIYHLSIGDRSIPNIYRPSIVKIPAGSTEFDADYNFRPIDALPGGAQLPIQIMDRFYYHENGIAYAIGNVEIPASVTDIVTAAGGFQNLTEDQVRTISDLLATEPSAAWLRIDLVAQTVSVIEGIPLTSPFTNLVMESDGIFYFGTTSDELDAVYRYDPGTGTATEAFTISLASGDIFDIIDLSRNN